MIVSERAAEPLFNVCWGNSGRVASATVFYEYRQKPCAAAYLVKGIAVEY